MNNLAVEKEPEEQKKNEAWPGIEALSLRMRT